MKSMKTIIRLLGATTLTTISLSTVVACSKTRTLQNDVDDITIVLKSGIQGKDLTSPSNTQQDAVNLFQAAALYINKDAIITLSNSADATTPLTPGDSTIKVIITLKTITNNGFEGRIIGVK